MQATSRTNAATALSRRRLGSRRASRK
jgi:hypothetical protein